MVMLVESILMLTIPRLFFPNTRPLYKNVYYSRKLIFLCPGKLDRSKYLQKFMQKYVKSKDETCEN